MRLQKRLKFGTVALLGLVLLALGSSVQQGRLHAQTLKQRKVTASTAAPSAVTAITYSFEVMSTSDIGSIELLHCSNSPLPVDPCTAPNGFDVGSASLVSQSGNPGFAIDNGQTAANRIVLTRTASAGNATVSTYSFTDITNPSTPNQTVYVRISTYATEDATGTATDDGAAAYATNNDFSVSSYVPPYLKFCVGLTVSVDCASSAGDQGSFGELKDFKPSTTTSQFSAATNDSSGYTVYVSGSTMTSGNNYIKPVINSTSIPGTSQFGMNLRNNSNPDVGSSAAGNGTAQPTSAYNKPNLYRFVSGEAVAKSAIATDFRRFTAAYVVNVPEGQEPGVYATTLTYTALASF